MNMFGYDWDGGEERRHDGIVWGGYLEIKSVSKVSTLSQKFSCVKKTSNVPTRAFVWTVMTKSVSWGKIAASRSFGRRTIKITLASYTQWFVIALYVCAVIMFALYIHWCLNLCALKMFASYVCAVKMFASYSLMFAYSLHIRVGVSNDEWIGQSRKTARRRIMLLLLEDIIIIGVYRCLGTLKVLVPQPAQRSIQSHPIHPT